MRKTLLPTTLPLALAWLALAGGCSHEAPVGPAARNVSASPAEVRDASTVPTASPVLDKAGSPAAEPADSTLNEPGENEPGTGELPETDEARSDDPTTTGGDDAIDEVSDTSGDNPPARARLAGNDRSDRGSAAEAAAAPSVPEEPPPAVSAASTRPRADRTPRRPGEAERITFDDLLLNMPADVVFRPFMLSDRVKELDGQRVRITGFMHGAAASTRGVKEFVLLKNTECKFGPGGQADHLAQVILREGNETRFSPESLIVEGTLKIEPFQGPDGNTWSIYRLENAVLK